MLYDDGKNLRLLTRLYEQDVSDYPKDDQEKYGVYTTGDSVIKVDHDNTVIYLYSYPALFPPGSFTPP